jgi:hypothetical protein
MAMIHEIITKTNCLTAFLCSNFVGKLKMVFLSKPLNNDIKDLPM